jgi:hypothetical protein
MAAAESLGRLGARLGAAAQAKAETRWAADVGEGSR